MSKVVYPVEVFDKAENGTVFYKDGIVVDDLRTAGPGILESWRYNFDAGKQVFRAEPKDGESDTFYERRLVKDQKGNPYWTAWMEIPMVEARGVQAIALNAGPLRLPNSDGAIKLEITPSLLGVFTRDESLSLIDQKIEDYEKKRTDYITWPINDLGDPLDLTPLQVLEQALPEGGYEGTLYIVARKPNAPAKELSTQWIWNVVKYDKRGPEEVAVMGWIQVAGGNATQALVSWAEYEAHVHANNVSFTEVEDRIVEVDANIRAEIAAVKEDLETAIDDHVSNDVIHVTQENKDLWDAMLPATEFVEHIENADGRIENLHVTLDEKDYWNKKPNHIPDGGKRYVGGEGTWQVAYEQTKFLPDLKTETAYSNGASQTVNNKYYIIPGDWATAFRNIRLQNGTVTGIQLDFNTINTRHLDCFFHTEDLDRKSQIFNSDSPAATNIWDMGAEKFDLLVLEFRADLGTSKPAISGLSVIFQYKLNDNITFGDGEAPTAAERLPVDIIGPEDKPLTYNGEPISGDRIAHWGDVEGEIQKQTDLTKFIWDSVGDRLHRAPQDTLRWEITNGDTWIPSLAQVKGEHHFNFSTDKKIVNSPIPSGGVFLGNLQANLFDNLEPTAMLASLTLRVDFMSSAETAGTVYFATDNPKIQRSFVWEGFRTAFEWQIPVVHTAGVLETFNEIRIWAINGSGSALRQANGIQIDAYSVSYDGVEVADENRNLWLRGKTVHMGEASAGIDDIYIRDIPLGAYFHERKITTPWVWAA